MRPHCGGLSRLFPTMKRLGLIRKTDLDFMTKFTMNSFGRILFALGFAGLGVLSLIYHSFASVWQPLPETFPHRELLGIISGSILLVSGICMLLPRLARRSTLVTAVFVSTWPALQIPFNLWETPLSASMWTTLAETVMLISGGYILYRSKAPDGSGTEINADSTGYFNRAFQLAFAVALPVISISHFVYAFSNPARTPPMDSILCGFNFSNGCGTRRSRNRDSFTDCIATGSHFGSNNDRFVCPHSACAVDLFPTNQPWILDSVVHRDRLQWCEFYRSLVYSQAGYSSAAGRGHCLTLTVTHVATQLIQPRRARTKRVRLRKLIFKFALRRAPSSYGTESKLQYPRADRSAIA